MTIVATEDTRNQEWRNSNVGSKMLEKMGWTEGKGIGKRNVNKTSLRAVKRQEGLGIGAKRQSEGGPSESTGTFAAVLANLKAHHNGTNNDSAQKRTTTTTTNTKVSKKEAKKEAKKAAKLAAKKAARKKHKLSLPQNKVLAGHARKMRAAKFGAKSAEDLACIFGNTEVVGTALGGAAAAAAPSVTFENATAKKRVRPSAKDDEKESDKKPKKEKKSKKDKKKKKSKNE